MVGEIALIEQSERTKQVTVELAQIDWRSTLAVLQAQAKQEAQCGNEEIANETRTLGQQIAVQL